MFSVNGLFILNFDLVNFRLVKVSHFYYFKMGLRPLQKKIVYVP